MACSPYPHRRLIPAFWQFPTGVAGDRAELLDLRSLAYACGDARIGQSLIGTAIDEGRKCARIVNKDLGGSPTDADREMLAIGAWSGETDRILRHEAEAEGTVRPGEDFFSGPWTRRR